MITVFGNSLQNNNQYLRLSSEVGFNADMPLKMPLPIPQNSQALSNVKGPIFAKGLTLIEVLMALLLIMSAASALTQLQSKALSLTQQILWRQQALLLAQDAVARMRLNAAASAYWRSADHWQNSIVQSAVSIDNRQHDCWRSRCTAEAMAQQELIYIQQLAAAYLPNGRLLLEDCPNTSAMCLVVMWSQTVPNSCDDETTECLWMGVLS